MVVMFKHPCPVCGVEQLGEVHLQCAKINLDQLPDPRNMTGEERYYEVLAYQHYPPGWPLDLLQQRVEVLIGRSFRKGGQVPTDTTDAQAMIAWMEQNEHTPQRTDLAGWRKYAEEAYDHKFPALLEEGEKV